ncbi:Anion exchange protein 3 [Oryzias melastigma]|uniref:Anion exchange protein 3 n=1 Tax=Oryzias melastigma TaxID=30732 RepID=A0A834BX53_ORYME|nr:Anion exchange protein 3 [Oryzias melastigma]
MQLMEKISARAEATLVLVGSVGFLDQPSMAFVRLQESVLLESVPGGSGPCKVSLPPAGTTFCQH